MTDQTIHIDEDYEEATKDSKSWTEEINVTGDQVVSKVQALLREAAVRKITVKDDNGKKLFSIPMYAGVAGVLVFGPWSALALIAAWVGNFSIIIERTGEKNVTEDVAESVKEQAADVAAAVEDEAA